MPDAHRYDLPTTFHEWGHRLSYENYQVHTGRWARHKYSLNSSLGADGTRLTGCEAHIQLARRAAGEGMVLLENNGLLPLQKGTTVALFGIGSLDYMKGGGGSGIVNSRYVSNLYNGFAGKLPDYPIYEPVTAFYYQYAMPRLGDLGNCCIMEEPALPDPLVKEAAGQADVAVITVYRYSSEAHDQKAEPGGFYLTEAERNMIRQVTDAFRHSVVVLNVGALVDVRWIRENPKIDAALLAWQGGMEGGAAIADVLCGDVNPSGKLTDTVAVDFDAYPTSQTFLESEEYVSYTEDIYVGYRYFETLPGRTKQVVYPFGYGLSYTSFAISKPLAELCGEEIRVTVAVRNTGCRPGKEVVQLYYSAPQGKLGKSALALAAYQKTRLLSPAEEQSITLSFPVADMASYDDVGKCVESAYLLEQGKYTFFAGNHCRNLQQADWCYVVEEPYRVIRQLSRCCAPNQLRKRLKSDGTYEELPQYPIAQPEISAPENTEKVPDPEKTYSLEQVSRGEISLDAFVSQMLPEELISLVSGIPCRGLSNTAGMGGISRLDVPPVMTADGPAGIRLKLDTGIATTAWPCATLLACTWDPELIYEIGVAGGMEAKENAIAIWLAPGMNIHRSPLCGRNFEYFSEDPLITGICASALVRGMQSVGVAASVKHFAANNKETNRLNSDSRISERALREIYLRGFEICIKQAQPWTVMTAYNLINGVRCCESYELLEQILRQEWGFAGMVTSDWEAICDQAKCVLAGNDVRMPYGFPERLKEALEDGTITRGHLENCAKHILSMILKLD